MMCFCPTDISAEAQEIKLIFANSHERVPANAWEQYSWGEIDMPTSLYKYALRLERQVAQHGYAIEVIPREALRFKSVA